VNPFYFGTGARRLFGLYTPPQKAGNGTRAVVLCYPWGREYLATHRAVRQLGKSLAGAGFHVLRFDYFGTGDSAGDMRQASVEGWEEDIVMAIDELKDTSGASRVSLAGVRLGATLAARVAARRPRDVDKLALWDPVVSGDDYVNELLGAAAPPPQGLPNGQEHQVAGFPLTAAMAGELRAIDLLALAPATAAPTLLVVSGDTDPTSSLRPAMATRFTGALDIEAIADRPVWIESGSFGADGTPVKVLQRIVEWLR